jgi:hypothetical protein
MFVVVIVNVYKISVIMCTSMLVFKVSIRVSYKMYYVVCKYLWILLQYVR